MKKLLAVLLTLSLIGTVCLFAVGCGDNPPDNSQVDGGTTGGGKVPLTATSYVVIDINPTVELTLSKGNKVVSVTASNDDAKVLLSETDVEGDTLESASEKLAEAAIDLGFISEEGNSNISITVVGDTVEIEEEVYNKIKEKFRACVQRECHFTLGVDKDVLLTLETELNALKEENPENEKIQALNLAQYRMIVSAMEKDATLTLEAALEMTTRDIIRTIRDGTLEQVEEELEILEMQTEHEIEMMKDQIYMEIDNGLVQMHSAAISVLREIEYQIELLEEYELEKLEIVSLTEEDVRHVATLLGLTAEETEAFVESCVGLDGVTYSVHNMEFAINRIYRNTPSAEREAFEEMYEAVEEYIENKEEKITIPHTLVVAIKEYAEQLLVAKPGAEVTIPADTELVKMEVFEEFAEDLEELIEETIEEMEETREDLISTLNLGKDVEARLKALEREIEAREEEAEREYEKLEEELEKEFKEDVNGWINRHENGTDPTP